MAYGYGRGRCPADIAEDAVLAAVGLLMLPAVAVLALIDAIS